MIYIIIYKYFFQRSILIKTPKSPRTEYTEKKITERFIKTVTVLAM